MTPRVKGRGATLAPCTSRQLIHEFEPTGQILKALRTARSLMSEGPCMFERKKGQSGIRTRGTRITLYTGLANQRLQPLGHLSMAPTFVSKQCSEVAPRRPCSITKKLRRTLAGCCGNALRFPRT